MHRAKSNESVHATLGWLVVRFGCCPTLHKGGAGCCPTDGPMTESGLRPQVAEAHGSQLPVNGHLVRRAQRGGAQYDRFCKRRPLCQVCWHVLLDRSGRRVKGRLNLAQWALRDGLPSRRTLRICEGYTRACPKIDKSEKHRPRKRTLGQMDHMEDQLDSRLTCTASELCLTASGRISDAKSLRNVPCGNH
jgi:hypothetical protein